jgi:hypothetical protein
MMEFRLIHGLLFFGIFFLIGFFVCQAANVTVEGMTTASDFASDPKYKEQLQLLSERFKEVSGTSTAANVSNPTAKRPITELLSKNVMPESQQSFVNFYGLGTRFTGYLGPMDNGFFDPDTAVQLAVQAGSRIFVLEIDYLEDCDNPTEKYFPQIVVRDIKGRLRMKVEGNRLNCQNNLNSNIRQVCEKINFYAFASSAQNASDPVVIVLYFVRQPPGSYKSKTVLDYFSNVAKAMEPLRNRMITNEIYGGSFYRQKQPDRLLLNKITDYNRKVLIFSNANTSGFREVKYKPNEDLDFMINLRLLYTQTKLGVTENDSGSIYGILQTTDDYLQIPPDRTQEVVDSTKLRWTICFSRDPSNPVNKQVYEQITKNFGVNCIPIQLFDLNNNFMFTDETFKTYSYQPKPEPLRYIKPGIVLPGEPNPAMNANQGKLLGPTIG